MTATKVASMMIAGVVVSSLISMFVYSVTFTIFLIASGATRALWVRYTVMALPLLFAGSTFVLGIRTCWRYVHRQRAGGKYFESSLGNTFYLAVAGALSSGALMFGGTLMLGHMRPMWMELSYWLPAAIAGLFLGAGIGLVLDIIDRGDYS